MRSLFLVAAFVASSQAVVAQECVGIPKDGRGFLAIGPIGAGTGLAFAYRRDDRSVLVGDKSAGVYGHANPLKTRWVQASKGVKALHGCVAAGIKWQSWDTEGAESTWWETNSPTLYQEHSKGGNWGRVRIPVGLSVGRTVNWKRVSFVPFANGFAVLELEDYQARYPVDAPAKSRRGFGGGFEYGFAFRAGWFMARPMCNNTNTHARALSGRSNLRECALHLGVIF